MFPAVLDTDFFHLRGCCACGPDAHAPTEVLGLPARCETCGQRVLQRAVVEPAGREGLDGTLTMDRDGLRVGDRALSWRQIRTVRRVDGRWLGTLIAETADGELVYRHDPRAIICVFTIIKALLDGDTLGAFTTKVLELIPPRWLVWLPVIWNLDSASVDVAAVYGAEWPLAEVPDEPPIRMLYRTLLRRVVAARSRGVLTQAVPLTGEAPDQCGQMTLALRSVHGRDDGIASMPGILDNILASLYIHAGVPLQNPQGVSGRLAVRDHDRPATIHFHVPEGETSVELSAAGPCVRLVT